MKRWIAGGAVALLMMFAAVMWNRAGPPAAAVRLGMPSVVSSAAAEPADDTAPLVAPKSDVTPADREARRFNRYDKDRNGDISRDEYLAARRKAFAKLDVDGDGKLSFDEYSVKAITKFTTADADRDHELGHAEFATTAIKRNPRTKAVCPPVVAEQADDKDAG